MATSPGDPHQTGQDTRRRVLQMAVPLRENRVDGSVDHFLALLQDRLPLWMRILNELTHRAGKGRVPDNLVPVARAGIDYYLDVQSAALPAFTSPAVTVRFRQALRDNGLGPPAEIRPLAAYLVAEQRLGRVVARVDPEASARLLLAGCFHHAYIEMFVGADAGPTRDACAEEIVRELRLEPVPG
ncbi:hypothetical protein ACIBQX_37675 [Nonomuraea sp. NPDC049714]|uniref:hypothetical protein n=1 Tax=Nonomuraea sp. NPDC049714 TaxID=3364357 RepID=UPI0037A13FB8